MLTAKQLLYQQFINSPQWQKIRNEALAYYGPICASCGQHGTDIHHKTYARFGGNELMRDLQVLCRACHDAKHSVERSARQSGHKRRGKRPWMRLAVAYRYLSKSQKAALCREFGFENEIDLYCRYDRHRGCIKRISKMLSVNITEYSKRLRRIAAAENRNHQKEMALKKKLELAENRPF